PIDSPITYAIRISHLSASGSSARASHSKIAQKTTAAHCDDIAYTSHSTAQNQNVTVKAQGSAPTSAEAITGNVCVALRPPSREIPTTSFRPTAVIVQNKKRSVNPLHAAGPIRIPKATCVVSPIGKLENRFCISRDDGAPA